MAISEWQIDLKDWSVQEVENELLSYMSEGRSLDEFLAENEIRKRKWDKYVTKHRKIQRALVDGVPFFRSYWRKKLEHHMFKSSTSVNNVLYKMHVEQTLGWSELAIKLLDQEKPRKMYKVYLDLGPDPGNEDQITPELPKKDKDARKAEKERFKQRLDELTKGEESNE